MDAMPLSLRMSVLDRAFKRRMGELCRDLELTGVQCGVLGRLCRMEREGAEEISQRELEERSHMAHPTMADVLGRLEAKGFVVSRRGSRDRRVKSISSTPRAAELLHTIRERDEAVTRELCRGLTEEQTAALYALTDVLVQNALAAGDLSCEPGGKDGLC